LKECCDTGTGTGTSAGAENEKLSLELLLQDMYDGVKVKIEKIPILMMKSVPTQPNGVDCGVYVTEYASLVHQKWPTSTSNDIEKQFDGYFNKVSFHHDDIVTKRVKIKSLLESFQSEYTVILADRQE